jgi:hypothetical protein
VKAAVTGVEQRQWKAVALDEGTVPLRDVARARYRHERHQRPAAFSA